MQNVLQMKQLSLLPKCKKLIFSSVFYKHLYAQMQVI
jgi:hypothetical protein